MKNEKGFTLIEMMISTSLVLLVMLGIFVMIDFHVELSKNQNARARLQQESRFFLSNFASDLKNAGSVITLAHTGGFLAAPPDFNGIYPLNNTDYADGIIVADADPNAVTQLTQEYTGGGVLLVKSTVVPYPGVAWNTDDKGIVISPTGYYVFSVTSVDTNSIAIRSTPVYYSGMLNVTQTTSGRTVDYNDDSVPTGDTVTYPVNAPVMRISNFSIYLVDEAYNWKLQRDIRSLIKITDANGDSSGNFLAADSQAVKGIIAENIWDFQVSYFCYPNFPDVSIKNTYFTASSSGLVDDLLTDIQSRFLKEVRVAIVALTEEYSGKDKRAEQIPAIGDRDAYMLPLGKYDYRLFTMSIEPRNFNIFF